MVSVIVIGAAGYWWQNRPPGEYKRDNGGLYPVNVSGRYGFMDRTGKTVISPQFDEARGFSEGQAAVRIGAKFGFIDTKGTMTITPQWVDVHEFRYGRAAVKLCCGPWTNAMAGDLYGIIGTDGKYVSSPTFPWIASHYSGGFLAVKTADGKFGFVDRTGKVAISGNFDLAGDFADGLAPARTGGRWGFIDTKGGWAVDPQFELALPFSEGLAGVQVGGRMGYVDRRGAFLINPQYDVIPWPFHQGFAQVAVGPKRGFIDTTGRMVVEPKFLNGLSFSDGLAAVQTEEGWGFIGPTGTVVVSPQFDAVPDFNEGFGFQNGLARVTVLGKEAYITPTGAFVVDPFPGTTVVAEKARIAAEAAQRASGPAVSQPQIPITPGRRDSEQQASTEATAEFISRTLDRADALFARQQYDAAVAECDAVLSRQPGHARARDLKFRILETKRILGR